MLRAQQAGKGPGAFRGLAKVAQQRGHQHILNQAGFARAGHARHRHQPLQGKGDIHVLQVVGAGPFQNQFGRVGLHRALKAKAHLLAPAQVGPGQGVGLAQLRGWAVKHNLPAAHAGAGAHVDDAVGGQHHGRVVLHHHQGVARVFQALHGQVDALHVARVQANAGLIEHKQGVHQTGAQRRGQVDALHLAARKGAALPIEC